MDSYCSYEGCRGSPKNISPNDKSLRFCEYHIEQHLLKSSTHSPITLSPPNQTSTLLANEMKLLSSTMSKVMLTGKDMFQQICRKLCEITDELTLRQDKLIGMASSLSTDQVLPQESFKELGNLGLNFKSADEFGRLVDDHFSNDNVKIDFSFFSKDIENIMNHVSQSNKLLEDVRVQVREDAESKSEMKNLVEGLRKNYADLEKKLDSKIEMAEGSRKICGELEKKLNSKIELVEQGVRKIETRFANNGNLKQLEERINFQEYSINSQNNYMEEVSSKFTTVVNGLSAQSNLAKIQENNLTQLAKNSQNQLKLQFDRLNSIVDKRVVEINQIVDRNLNTMGEGFNRRQRDIKVSFEGKIDELNTKFDNFCNGITDQVSQLSSNYEFKLLDFNTDFSERIRQEIELYGQFNNEYGASISKDYQVNAFRPYSSDESRRLQEDNERKRKELEEIKRKQDQEIRRKKIEDDRIFKGREQSKFSKTQRELGVGGKNNQILNI